MFMSAWGSVGVVVSGSLFIFITVDNLVQVALGIPSFDTLGVIAKPSYPDSYRDQAAINTSR